MDARVEGMNSKSIINQLPNNCGEQLFFLSTMSVRTGKGKKLKQVKILKPSGFTLRFVGDNNKKRDRS